MFNKINEKFNNSMRKIVYAMVALSMAVAGVSVVPAFADAKGNQGEHHKQKFGLALGLKNNMNDEKLMGFGIKTGDPVFDAGVKSAKTVFKNAVKKANNDYRIALKSARATFVASMKAATDTIARTAALKTYLTARLTAFKTKSAAIEAAFSAFIDTKFNVNQVPAANAKTVTLNENTSTNIILTGSDPENSTLSFMVVSNPTHGVLLGTAPNLTYTPNTNFNGTDSFTFKVNDGNQDSIVATVSITINGVNQVPVANAQTISLTQNTSKAITLTGSDPEGSAITFSVIANPTHGTLSGTAPALTYQPTANFTGSDSFTFKANDGTLDSATATVSITVNP